MAQFNIRFINTNGQETTKSISSGTTVGNIIDTARYTAILNGEEVGSGVQLRSGDVLEQGLKTGKAGC